MAISYTTDPYNRLIAKLSGRATGIRRYRTTLDGEFKTGKGNTLVYTVRTPSAIPPAIPPGANARARRRLLNSPDDPGRSPGRKMSYSAPGENLPYLLRLKGHYSLDPTHNLIFTTEQTQTAASGRLKLHGQIVDVRRNELVFSMATRDEQGRERLYLLHLEGAWQADERNRLTFAVKKDREAADQLVFQSAWELNKNQEIVYSFGKGNTVIFKGNWRIPPGPVGRPKRTAKCSAWLRKTGTGYFFQQNNTLEKSSLSPFFLHYQLEAGSTSLTFSTSLRKATPRSIIYDIGIKTSVNRKPVTRTVTFFGSWRLDKAKGLIFEVRDANRPARQFVFGAEITAQGGNKLKAKLLLAKHTPAGAELELSRELARGAGEWYIRLQKEARERAVYIGFGKMW